MPRERAAPSDGRLTIYSVGPDLKDGHGAYDPKRWLKGGPDDVGATAWDVDRRGEPAGGDAEEGPGGR